MRNIAFNALSARAGAGISVFQSLMPAIAEIDETNNYFIFVAKEQKDIIDYIPDRFKKIILENVPLNPYFRVLWEQVFMSFYLKKFKIDLLYSVGNTTVLFAPCKVLLFIESINPFSKVIKKWALKEKVRNKLLFILGYLSARKADRIRFCSYRSMEIISEIFKIDKNKCFVLYHGLKDNWFHSDSNISPVAYNYILSVSVVAPHKNFEVLIKAFQLLKNRNMYDGKLLIIGDTCYRDYYRKLTCLVRESGLEEDILFIGKKSNNELIHYYNYCDIFVFPSLEETFGIPLIEALSQAVPVIASDGEKYRNLFIPFNEIGKDMVIYFDPYSEVDLYEKMIYALKNRDEIKNKLKERIQEIRESFDILNVARQLICEFNNL